MYIAVLLVTFFGFVSSNPFHVEDGTESVIKDLAFDDDTISPDLNLSALPTLRPSDTSDLLKTVESSQTSDNCNEISIIFSTFADFPNAVGKTFLHTAAEQGQVKVAETVIKAGASINRADHFGKTALHYAAANGNEKCVELLVQNGATVTVKDNDGNEPMQLASNAGNRNIVDLLIKTRGEKGKNMLHVAVENGDESLIKVLISNLVDINAKDDDGNTPLHLSTSKDDYSISKTLIMNGADVNATDKNGNTALHLAASIATTEDERWQQYSPERTVRIADLLVKAKADLNIENNNGDTPWILAKSSGNKGIYEDMLFKNGKKASYSEVYDDPDALIDAVSKRNFDRVRELVEEAGINVNKQNDVGDTALILAVSEAGDYGIVDYLIKNRANVTLSNSIGMTALHVASSIGNTEIADLLIQNGADIDTRDKMGETSLLLAVKGGHIEMVRKLIEKGASLYTAQNQGKTPVEIARNKGYVEIADLLRRNDFGGNIEESDDSFWSKFNEHSSNVNL